MKTIDLSQELHQNRHHLNRLWTMQLYKEFENICFHYRLKLRKPVFQIESLSSRWGQWDPVSRTITLARELIQSYSWDAVLEVLKHEVAHLIVNEYFGIADHTHGPDFEQACQMIGASPWATASEADLQRPIISWKDRNLSDEEEKLLRRVEKLLALATSSNEHEAVLAMKKVRDLYSRYNIEQLQSNKKPEQVYVLINNKQKRIPQHESMIASILNSHFFVEVIYSSLYDAELCQSHKVIEIMGTAENVQMAEYVYHFLRNQLPILWENYKSETGASGGRSKRSYYLGVLTGFDEKLRRDSSMISRAGTTWSYEETPEVKALIRKADNQLQTYVRFRHPRLVTRRWDASLRDAGSFEKGKQAGARLTLHRAVTQRGRDSVKLLK